MLLTLTHVQVHHPGIHIRFGGAESPCHGWQGKRYVRDGQGLADQRPSSHSNHKRDGVDQSTLLKRQQLIDCVMNLDVGNLHVRKWRCKFLSMVLQCRQLCFSNLDTKNTSLHLKFCLYIVSVKLTYF